MKIKRFQKKITEKGVDLAIFFNIDSLNQDNDLVYFTEYKGVGALVVPKNRLSFLVVPEMEYGRIKGKGMRVHKLKKKKKLFEEIKEILKKKKIRYKKIGINENVVTVNLYKALRKGFTKCNFKDLSLDCDTVRAVKTQKEILMIKKACAVTDKIFSGLVCGFKKKKFKKEKEVVGFIDEMARTEGCELAFPPVVASGRGASVAHYEAQNVKLRKGFLILDFGVRYKNYNSDMTRTIYLGTPSKKERNVYNLLLRIQKKAIEKVKLGEYAGKIYDFVSEEMGDFAEYFNHGLGHGIGIKVHEPPNLTYLSKDKIKKNMVFTVEPGIYIENKFGIRIEDTVVMKEKATRLTKSTKVLLSVPKV